MQFEYNKQTKNPTTTKTHNTHYFGIIWQQSFFTATLPFKSLGFIQVNVYFDSKDLL